MDFIIDYGRLYRARPSGAKCVGVLLLFVVFFGRMVFFHTTSFEIGSAPAEPDVMSGLTILLFQIAAALPYCFVARWKLLLPYCYMVTYLYAVLYSLGISAVVMLSCGLAKTTPPNWLYVVFSPQCIHVLLSVGFALYARRGKHPDAEP